MSSFLNPLSVSFLFQNGYHMFLSFIIVLSLRHVALFFRQDKYLDSFSQMYISCYVLVPKTCMLRDPHEVRVEDDLISLYLLDNQISANVSIFSCILAITSVNGSEWFQQCLW